MEPCWTDWEQGGFHGQLSHQCHTGCLGVGGMREEEATAPCAYIKPGGEFTSSSTRWNWSPSPEKQLQLQNGILWAQFQNRFRLLLDLTVSRFQQEEGRKKNHASSLLWVSHKGAKSPKALGHPVLISQAPSS